LARERCLEQVGFEKTLPQWESSGKTDRYNFLLCEKCDPLQPNGEVADENSPKSTLQTGFLGCFVAQTGGVIAAWICADQLEHSKALGPRESGLVSRAHVPLSRQGSINFAAGPRVVDADRPKES
jgi:hypothetical protein